MPKILNFKFGDYRDWFIPKTDMTNLHLDTLIIKCNGKIYKIKNVPCNVASITIQVPISVDIARKSHYSFEKYDLDFVELYFTPGPKLDSLIVINGFKGSLIKDENILHSKTRVWNNGNGIISFAREEIFKGKVR